ncbi:iron complex outermembrane receptor protein [Methylorubrum rhodinum]|uniref:Iron complex outermembrane receptor protein n=1 Tax=Methylorubrum rhodinum TaxID=29428 RepID=A0A840ZHJ4_9HYPH|nr:TonB-dependent siderophore receptor [Methylorubrum rhodinum]MBB5756750.1 iron complex outermembrane receptor protein [Methylorubrum rhodinum]
MSFSRSRHARPILAVLSAALPFSASAQILAPAETRLDEIAVAGDRAVPANAPADAIGAEAAATLRKPSLTQASPVGLNLRTPSRGASRLGLTPLETPASLDIISGETIRLRGQSSVLEAVSQNGTGITAFGSPGFGLGAFTSRGFAGQNSIQTLFDGTRLYVGANTLTFPFDTWNVERIEVLRGPASVLYGEGAIGGIVNVVSKKPLFTPLNVARVGLGSDGLVRAAIDSTGPIGESLAYRLNVSGNRADGWIAPNGEFRNLAVSGALTLQATPDLAFTLSHDLGYQEPVRYWGTPLVNGRVLDAVRFNNYNVRDAKITWADNWTQLRTEWTPSADVTVRNTAYRLRSRRHWLDVEQYAYDPSTGRVNRSDYLDITHSQEQIGNRFDATFRGSLFGLPNQFTAGFDVNHISFRHANNFSGTFQETPTSVPLLGYDPGLFPANGRAVPAYATTTNQASVFAENRLELTDRLSLLAGVRFDAPRLARLNLLNGSSFERSYRALGYRFGLVYAVSPETTLYAQYATATDPVNSLISLSGSLAGYELSTGRQVEIGAKGLAFGGAVEWTLAGYRIVKNDLITAVPGDTTRTAQVGQQSSLGAEAALSWLPAPGWRIDANLALLDAQYDTFSETVDINGVPTEIPYNGNQPVNVPEQVANLWINWAFARDWEARVGVQYVGAVFSDFANRAPRPDYTLVTLGLDHQVTPASRLSFRVFNLLDTVYAIDGSVATGGMTRGTSTSWYLGRPRSFEVAYTVAW